jgi:peptidoglycan/xylan/chitin deacetylase (PgdA/CDA1 family)
MLVNGARVVDQRLDSALAKPGLELVTVGYADHEQVVDVPSSRSLDGHDHSRVRERGPVALRQLPAPRVPIIQAPELHFQGSRLQRIEAAGDSVAVDRLAALGFTVLAELASAAGERPIIRHDHAAVPESAEVLRRVEAERRGVRQGSRPSTVVFRAVRLARVLDHRELMGTRELDDRIHVGALAVEMYRNDRLGLGCRCPLEFRWVERERVGVGVHQHRSGPGGVDRRHRRHARVRGSDHLVAGSHAGRRERESQCIGPGRDTHGVPSAAVLRERSFEAVDNRAQRGTAGVENARHRLKQFVAELRVVAGQVDEGNSQVDRSETLDNAIVAPARAAYIDRLIARHGVAVASATIAAVTRSPLRVGLALLYHEVGDPAGDPERDLVPRTGVARFREELRLFASSFRVVPAGELRDAVVARRRGEPIPLAITFDDDLRSHVDVAMPILTELGLPATFFLSGASSEGPFAFWWELLQAAVDLSLDLRTTLPPFIEHAEPGTSIHNLGRQIEALSPAAQVEVHDALKALVGDRFQPRGMPLDHAAVLAQAGFEVGFHTRAHYRLDALNDGQLVNALQAGREVVERAVHRPLKVIAYPHGAGDGRVASAAHDAGYVAGFIGSGRGVRPGIDPLLQPRVGSSPRSLGHSALSLARALIRGSYDRRSHD